MKSPVQQPEPSPTPLEDFASQKDQGELLRWTFVQEIRSALRTFQQRPFLCGLAIVVLALGIGLNAALFSATFNLLFSPLPYFEPDRLVSLFETAKDGSRRNAAWPNIEDWQDEVATLEGTAAFRPRTFALQVDSSDTISVVQIGMVTPGFFSVLGVLPSLGRLFSAQDDRDQIAAVMLTDSLWHQQFGGDPAIKGKTLRLNEAPFTVIGILPPEFSFPMDGKVPAAFILLDKGVYGERRHQRTLGAVGRRKHDASLRQVGTELSGVAERLAQAYPNTNRNFGAGLESLEDSLRGPHREPLLLLAGAGILVLMIACSTAANLLLSSFLARRRDFALRSALGASETAILRLLMLESLALTGSGALLGLVVTAASLASLPAILDLLGAPLPAAIGTSLPGMASGDLASFTATALAAAALALVTGLALAWLPGLAVRGRGWASLLQTGGAPTEGRGRWRESLVVGQIGLCVILLLTSGLLLRSFSSLLSTSPGFSTTRVLKFGIGLPEIRYNTEPAFIAFHQRLLESLEQIPGVEAAGAIARLPLSGRGFSGGFLPEGEAADNNQWPRAAINLASANYFPSLATPLLEGRLFSSFDSTESPRVILVNQAFRLQHLGGKSAVGKRLRLTWFSEINPRETPWEIVGVVGDTHQTSLEEPPKPEIFLPMSQFPADGCSYVLRHAPGASGIEAAVRSAVEKIDPGLEKLRIESLGAVVDRSLANRQLALYLVAGLAALAILLTILSLYGVITFWVAQSQRELAIRRCLGARRGQVAALALNRGLRLMALGAGVGAIGYLLLSRWLRSHLHQVSTLDPWTFVVASLLLVTLTVLACALPSVRVARASLRILTQETNA
ncbi:MAG: ADOP family duplicated permease [Deltaproteobacteria bacterium]|nr:ADOP family duplicated permease [Deltaproteobacteria bacterium]